MTLQIHRLSYSLGAQITGVDISRPMESVTFDAIQRAFLEYGVLLFRDAPLTREQHIAFSRRFGIVDKCEAIAHRIPEYPEIFLLNPEPGVETAAYVGDYWHSDNSYMLVPAMASLLRCVTPPDLGGDTMFANMYLAYDTLSDGMKTMLEGLHAVHQGGSLRIDNSTPERALETRRLNPPVAQPVVRVHPETGRKALYLSIKVRQFVGMTAQESKPLIEFLCWHSQRSQFVYRHQWQKDDLVMWDNRCTMHYAVGDYDHRQRRHMERTQVRGTPSGYVYGGPIEA